MITLETLQSYLPDMDNERKRWITYLVHGWGMATLDIGVANRLVADKTGPVFETELIAKIDDHNPEEIKNLVENVIFKYKNTNTEELKTIAIQENSPWHQAYQHQYKSSIRPLDIKDHFTHMALEKK